jgi:hypothetical protein
VARMLNLRQGRDRITGLIRTALVEVEAAVGKVISLAGYRDLLSERPAACEMGATPSPKDKEPLGAAPVSDRN